MRWYLVLTYWSLVLKIDALAGDRSGGTMHEASRRILSVLLQKVEGFASAKDHSRVCHESVRKRIYVTFIWDY